MYLNYNHVCMFFYMDKDWYKTCYTIYTNCNMYMTIIIMSNIY